MLTAKVDGKWLSTIGGHGPITITFGLHGSESASWEMDSNVRHVALRGNRSVEIYDGGFRIWVGVLQEPGSDGSYFAEGIWRQAVGVPALDATGVPTTVTDTAVAQAQARGEISWTYGTSISSTAWAAASSDLTLEKLLDGVSDEYGTRWVVSADYVLSMQADPTTPLWNVPHAVAGKGLTPAEDEFYTHLVGLYYSATGVISSVTVGSSDAAAVFGRRTASVDLTVMGVITSARATAVIQGMFLRSGARMGWAEGLELTRGQITSTGGTAATLSQIQSLQMVRLEGVVDSSRAYLLPTQTDIVLATSTYTDGSHTISLTPTGYAPRSMADVLTVAVDE